MKSILYNHTIHLLGLLLTVAFVPGCGTDVEQAQDETLEESDPGQVVLTAAQYQMAGIALGKPAMRSLGNVLHVTGQLDLPPQNMASVSAPLGGFVKSTELLEGMHVKKGQLIANIENPDFVRLQQEYLEAKSRLNYLELDYKRQQELSEEQVTSAKAFQQTAADYSVVKAQEEALAERLRIIGMNPNTLRNGRISRILPLYAPIEGYVTYINANIGQYVNPTDVLFRIADTEHLHVELTVFEKDVAALRKGQVVRYALPGEGEAQHEARIYLIGKEISADRTVQVHAHLDEEDKDLIPGMYVQAMVQMEGQQVLALPEAAVVQDSGHDVIFLYLGEERQGPRLLKKFREVPVERGVAAGGYVQVVLPEGVAASEPNFVLKGAYALLSKLRNAEEEE